MCRIPLGNRPVRRASRAGVRASIVARKPGNSGRAKGRRKVDEMSSWLPRSTTPVPDGPRADSGFTGRKASSPRDSIPRGWFGDSHADGPL